MSKGVVTTDHTRTAMARVHRLAARAQAFEAKKPVRSYPPRKRRTRRQNGNVTLAIIFVLVGLVFAGVFYAT